MPERQNFPLAFHITFGTYGTRLHGDSRGTVNRAINQFGDSIIGTHADWQTEELATLKYPRRLLTVEQRLAIEEAVPSICERGGWAYLVSAAKPDHVHNLIRATVDGADVRKWLKRWISESLSKRWPTQPGQAWWAECGSVKWVWTPDYYDRVEQYVRSQRTAT